ncbi:MAG TPA: hypothetical protein VMD30_08105 [Tepidisphaeraceae bacterium]|nr:hypothetical protein [Tepidisphaeraceae bacterium]
MKTIFSTLSCLAWGLWFGGLVALFIFVTTLFQWNHDMAVQTAPRLFAVFEPYQVIVAAVTLLSTIAWRWTARRGLISVIFLLALATAGAILSPVFLSPRMHELIAAGQLGSPQWWRLHGESMIVYCFDTVCLLLVGLLLPISLRRN